LNATSVEVQQRKAEFLKPKSADGAG
jgi:hypothetical protein